ncbi:ABC transporter permease [Streptomyces sp. NBC_01498]|uniref:ABC transporter permease n=1 Tax=Streptomyces sp. NBC_01498 TaxID=2975870 RepID=UPI002E7AFEAA|nr:ABC transporter permease [Streptomyces sp. NBC_01498]WTL27013.1 ABC transporter permease [Streptomyces sp. NBC_01498]
MGTPPATRPATAAPPGTSVSPAGAAGPAGPRRPRRLARRLVPFAVSAAGLLVGLGVWQWAGQRDPVLFATPGRSFSSLATMTEDGTLPSALLSSGRLLVVGLALAIVAGVGFGLLLSRARLLRSSTDWLLFALQSVPIVALAPLILSAFGFGLPAKTLVVFLTAVFPITVNTAEGAHRVPATLLEVARTYRSSEWRIWKDVLLPHTVPYAMTGVRQGIAMAFVGTLAAEFFLNASGVGGLLLAASTRFDSATVLGLTLLVSVLAVALMGCGRAVEGYFARWREVES